MKTSYQIECSALKNGVAVIVALMIAGSCAWAAGKPNIVFILADDLGSADAGFRGGKTPTPNLDRIAAESLELTQHYVYPVCSPTRAALLSGRYATGSESPTRRTRARFHGKP